MFTTQGVYKLVDQPNAYCQHIKFDTWYIDEIGNLRVTTLQHYQRSKLIDCPWVIKIYINFEEQ